MAEKFSTTPDEIEPLPENEQENRETRIAHLIEYSRHNMHRLANPEYAQDIHEIFQEVLAQLFKDLHVTEIEAFTEHIMERLKRGEHDLIAEFLANLSKLQYEDFAQEFLKLQAVPVAVIDDQLSQGTAKLGHAAVSSYDNI